MSGGGGGGTLDHAALTHLDYPSAGHTGFEGVQLVTAPHTWLDLSDPAYFVPAPPFPELGSLSITPAGAELSGNDAYAGLSTGVRYGIVFRGRFYPDLTGNLAVRADVDQYIPGDDVAVHYRFLLLMMNVAMTNAASEYAHGLMYGAKPLVGKEAFDFVTEATGFPYSAPAVRKAVSGNQNQLADNSDFFVRFKQRWWYAAGTAAFFYTTHAYFSANGGATVYGGDLADVDKRAAFQSAGYHGLRMFVGAFCASPSIRFHARIKSITMESGVYVPI